MNLNSIYNELFATAQKRKYERYITLANRLDEDGLLTAFSKLQPAQQKEAMYAIIDGIDDTQKFKRIAGFLSKYKDIMNLLKEEN